MEDENHLIKERIRKLAELRELGIEPYPTRFEKTHDALQVKESHAGLKNEEKTEDKVSVAGRIMQMRSMGKISFLTIQDQSGKIQLYFQQNTLGDNYKILKKFDIGDIIGASGTVFRTKSGEITVDISDFSMLTKSIRPLPEKYHGLKDDELRFRHRELDLIMNPQVREVITKRSLMMRYIREFLDNKGFIEMTTPILQTQYGGANARPFITKINAWNMQMYLKIASELYLKRLLVGGYEKIYDLNYNFRNEGVDKTHNPEFFMMEYYWAYADRDMMLDLTEELWEYVALKVNGTTKVKIAEKEIDMKRPWKRITMKDALKEYADIDLDSLSDADLKDMLEKNSIAYDDFSRGVAMSLLFEHFVEEKLIEPTHVLDHPIESTPLCKPTSYDPLIVERAEFYVNGWELGNIYSELNDPVLQRKLLEEQANLLRAGAEEAHPMDENFIQAIEYGMPPAGGVGLGIDRMAILLTGADSIREVIPFPTMKPREQ